MATHEIRTLPKWAQKLLDDHHRELDRQRHELENTRKAHAVLTNREWFVLSGPDFADKDEVRGLFVLSRNHAGQLCSLGYGDMLLVGRRIEAADAAKE